MDPCSSNSCCSRVNCICIIFSMFYTLFISITDLVFIRTAPFFLKRNKLAQRSKTFSNTSTAWIQVWLHLIPGLAESKRVSVLSVPWIVSIQNSSEDNATELNNNRLIFIFLWPWLSPILLFFSLYLILEMQQNKSSIHVTPFKMV